MGLIMHTNLFSEGKNEGLGAQTRVVLCLPSRDLGAPACTGNVTPG